MGERDTGSVEVMGSSPTVSTIAENVINKAFSAIFLCFIRLKFRAICSLKANKKLTQNFNLIRAEYYTYTEYTLRQRCLQDGSGRYVLDFSMMIRK